MLIYPSNCLVLDASDPLENDVVDSLEEKNNKTVYQKKSNTNWNSSRRRPRWNSGVTRQMSGQEWWYKPSQKHKLKNRLYITSEASSVHIQPITTLRA